MVYGMYCLEQTSSLQIFKLLDPDSFFWDLFQTWFCNDFSNDDDGSDDGNNDDGNDDIGKVDDGNAR